MNEPDMKTCERGYWIFTFGSGHAYPGKYVRVYGTYREARIKMMDFFGLHWGFQHSEQEWKEMEADPERYWPMETEVWIDGLSAPHEMNDYEQ